MSTAAGRAAAGGAVSTAGRAQPVRAVAERVVCLVNEVVAGARPARQVTPLFRMHLRGMLHRTRPVPGGVARIRRLVITSHSDGVYEVVAVCAREQRVSALGLQLTCTADGWQVTDVAHPQLGGPPSVLLSDPPSGVRRQ